MTEWTGASKAGLLVEGVSHSFGKVEVLHDIAMTVARGEVGCLLGPSGCGKSTLLRLVAGLETLQSGRIVLDGQDVAGPDTRVPPERRSIGFVFQDYALFPHLSVRANVAFGVAKTEATRVESLLDQVEMAGLADAMPHTLSGGQQQRVALARALARTPTVMLLDEPFSGLDARLREEVRRATLDVLRRANVATLMVTHDPQEAMVAGDRIIVMGAGRVLQAGSPETVYGRSADLRIAETFGPVNRWDGTVSDGQVATPLGFVAAPSGLPDGTAVTVALRPESIGVLPPRTQLGDSVEATVERVTHEGATVSLAARTASGVIVDVRDLARHGVGVGQTVLLDLGESVAMIFRRSSEHPSADARG